MVNNGFPAYMKNIIKNSPFDFVELEKHTFFQEGPGLRNWQFTTTGIKVINVTNMVDGTLDLSKTDRHIASQEVEEKYRHFLIDEDDIVVASSGNSWGKVSVVKKEHLPLLMNTSVIRFKTLNEEELDWSFLVQYLKSSIFIKQISMLITGSAQPNFGPSHLKKTYIPLPEIKEQRKIAAILSSVDDAIEKTEAIIEKTEKVKYGLIQQLLTKGLNHTKYKLTDVGEIPAEWKVKTLKEISKFIDYRGKTPKKTDSGIRLITAKNIRKGYISLEPEEYIAEDAYDAWMTRGIPEKGDILFTTEAPLGNVAQLLLDEKVAFAQRVIIIQPDKSINKLFFKYLLMSDSIQKSIDIYSSGSTVKGIKSSNLKKISVAIPGYKEQEKIASIIFSFEEKVENEKRKLFQLNIIKKGLMQVLLTGRVRVKVDEHEVVTK